MRIEASREFDIFRLFCKSAAQHEAADHPYDPVLLEDEINDRIEEIGHEFLGDAWFQVCCPDDVSDPYFTVAYWNYRYGDDDAQVFAEPFNNPQEAKQALPTAVVALLEHINGETFHL